MTRVDDDGPVLRAVVELDDCDPVRALAGTVLTVVHGPYGEDDAALMARAEHREGWEFFLPRLAELLAA